MTTTTLYIADTYAHGCPPHPRGPQVGYGLSRKQAIAACEPWDIQATYFRRCARALVLVDGRPEGSEHLRAALYGIDRSVSPPHVAIHAALHALNFSHAVRLAVECGILADSYSGRYSRKPPRRRIDKSFSLLPDSAKRIADEARRSGISQSEVVDRLTDHLDGTDRHPALETVASRQAR